MCSLALAEMKYYSTIILLICEISAYEKKERVKCVLYSSAGVCDQSDIQHMLKKVFTYWDS